MGRCFRVVEAGNSKIGLGCRVQEAALRSRRFRLAIDRSDRVTYYNTLEHATLYASHEARACLCEITRISAEMRKSWRPMPRLRGGVHIQFGVQGFR